MLLAFHPAHAASSEADAAAREAAVRLARSGDVDSALQRLTELHARDPEDDRVRHDLAVVSAWAGDDARTVALLQEEAPQALPDYVLDAYAKAARNLQQWPLAIDLYRLLAGRAPAAATPRLALGNL